MDRTNHEIFLVKRLMTGNEKAFRSLFETYRNDVYVYSISMLKTHPLAEEIVQEVFLNIWKHRNRLNPELSFKSYVFTITRNLTFNLISKTANNRKLKKMVFYESQRSYSPIENKTAESHYETLKKKAIEQLPPRRRLIFEMSREEDKNYKEISKELNISISTVKGQMSKALATIKDFLIKHGDVALSITLISSNWLA